MSEDTVAKIATCACIAEMMRKGLLVLEKVAVTRNAIHAIQYSDGVYKHFVIMEPREVTIVKAGEYVGVYSISGDLLTTIVNDGCLVFVKRGYEELRSQSSNLLVLRTLRKRRLKLYVAVRGSGELTSLPAKLGDAFLEARGLFEAIEAEAL